MPPRNVHFLDGTKNEITGFFQNGSVTWYEFSEWMHIFFANPVSDYAIFPSGCLEQHEPQDPVALHGPAISLSGNRLPVDPGYYIILSPDGKFS
jgi:hypothetical protein